MKKTLTLLLRAFARTMALALKTTLNFSSTTLTTCMSRKRAFTLAARAKKRPKDLSKNANSNSKATNAALSSLMIKDLLNFNALAF